jgi:uncharacterized C2H2 Zn-finger protein
MKYAHSDKRHESCPHCDAKFKQKMNLRAHLANIHDIDQIRGKYFEENKRNIFKCEDCGSEFNYKKSLTLHRKTKNAVNSYMFEYEICHSKFSYINKLASHIKLNMRS